MPGDVAGGLAGAGLLGGADAGAEAGLAAWDVTCGEPYVPAQRDGIAATAGAVPAAVLPGGRPGEPER